MGETPEAAGGPRRRPPVVAVVGGLDPSGGAGVIADARTVSELGAIPLVIATAVTVQAGLGVQSFSSVDVGLVVDQTAALADRFEIDAWKVGQIPSHEIAAELAQIWRQEPSPLVVLDPVCGATGGGSLVGNGPGEEPPARALFTLATLLTVNLEEAERFVGFRVDDVAAMERAGAALLETGAHAVLVKGGHLSGAPVDVLVDGSGTTRFAEIERVPGPTMHGTGCALASAAAVSLATGRCDAAEPSMVSTPAALREAVELGRSHVRKLLEGAVSIDDGATIRPPFGLSSTFASKF